MYQETVKIYNIALNKGWYVAVSLAGISVLLALCFLLSVEENGCEG
jgi:hypothetical protein